MTTKIYGQIISKDAADENFGAVTNSYSFNTADLRNYADGTTDLIMFYIENDNTSVLGDNRVPLFPDDSVLDTGKVCSVYSKSKFIELLDTGQDTKTFVELRSETLTITNGNYTLEYGSTCPPICQNQ